MLKRITAQNFKAFGQNPGLEVSLSKLNFFLGENNSGKTSAVDVVALFVQTARNQNVNGLKWSNGLIDLGSNGADAVHGGVVTDVLQIEVEIQIGNEFFQKVRSQIGGAQGGGTIGYRIGFRPNKYRYTYEFLMNGNMLARNSVKDLSNGGSRAELEVPALAPGGEPLIASEWGTSIFSHNLFGVQSPVTGVAANVLEIVRFGIQSIRDFLSEKVFLLGAGREIRRRNLNDNIKVPDVGRNGEHTLQVLSAVFAMPEHRAAAAKIREWANNFGLPDLSSGWAGGSELHSGYTDSPTAAPLPLRSAGFGSQQILPIIVLLFASPHDSVVLIEEPEISLHPAAQVLLVRMLADAARAGRQILVTTHSQYVVMALQERVNQDLPPDAIRVYHFSRERGDSTAKELKIDSDGILSGWIPSFAEVERKLLGDWMSKVHDKLKNE
ncbi:MAG: AAA family ATPase [Candidatus Sulfotelmatobacter sp.]